MNYVRKLFNGRIGRKNYGLGLLFFILIFVFFFVILAYASLDDNQLFFTVSVVVLYVVFIVHIISLHARRFHDLGDSAWRVFLFLIPLVNLIMLISLLATKGKDEANKYGEVPPKSIKFFDAIFNRNQTVLVVVDDQNKHSQYCAKCGAQVESSSKFCYKCGAKVVVLNQ